MKKKIKPVPKFKNEQDEREFWSTHDTTDYFDFSESSRVEIEFDPGVEAPVNLFRFDCRARCSINSRSWPIKRIFLISRSLKFTWRKRSPKSGKRVRSCFQGKKDRAFDTSKGAAHSVALSLRRWAEHVPVKN
jgi:hypothetical protein